MVLKKRVCSRCGHEETETILAHHTFTAGGCDKCGTYLYADDDDYQIYIYVYSSIEDALNDDENKKVLYFSFPASTEISEIDLTSLIRMKSNYTTKTVSYLILDGDTFEQNGDLYSMADLKRDSPIYIVVE